MKKIIPMLLGLFIASFAVMAIPKEIKKDFQRIEKSIKMKIEVVKLNIETIIQAVPVLERSPGDQNQFSFITTIINAEKNVDLVIHYSWRTRNYFENFSNRYRSITEGSVFGLPSRC